MIDLCRRIGFERQIILVHGATGALAVDELVVPEAGLELRAWVHPLQVRRLGSTQWVPSGTQKKVWLSRVGQGVSGGGLTEEIEVEHELARRGWLIVRPEELSIDEQVDLLTGASHVAGVEGSALHTLVLLRGFGGTVDVVRRIWNPTFDLIARVEGWDQRWIDPVGGRTIKVPGLNRFSGEDIEWPLVEGIDVAATALAIDRSSRRSQRV
jgi:capsular polysaccharide biosynthesis protein